MPAFPGGFNDAPRDESAVRTQAPAGAPAVANSGLASGLAGEADSPFVLPIERLPLGRQSLGLTVDVQAPAVVNLNQETRLKIVVRNTSSTDAMGVVVRDQLPEGLAYIDSQPPCLQPAGPILTWKLGTLAANSERVLVVRVKPIQVGSFDHAATVVMMAGGKSRTLVQQPKLKVEQTVKRGKVLKGGQVEFNIAVSNPGTGPARNVVVKAKLSSGLRHEQGDYIEQTMPLIKPGERIELEPLLADAVAGGEQQCVVSAQSPDVPQEGEEARAAVAMLVVEPKLELKLSGPAQRFTDTVAVYKLLVENPGSSPAREVRVAATLPVGGTLLPEPADAPHHRQYDRFKRRIVWSIPQLEPKVPVVLSFSVRLGGVQLYQVATEARSDAPLALAAKDTYSTDVTGMADVQYQVSEPRRVVDVGEQTDYEIRIKNHGSKEAARLLINARLSEHLEVVHTMGTDENAKRSPDGREVVFPIIERLAPKGELLLTIHVKAVQAGTATCQVFLMHDDLGNSRLTRSAATLITAAGDSSRR